MLPYLKFINNSRCINIDVGIKRRIINAGSKVITMPKAKVNLYDEEGKYIGLVDHNTKLDIYDETSESTCKAP